MAVSVLDASVAVRWLVPEVGTPEARELFVRPALLLALRRSHKLPDCLCLALAEREGAELVTADRRLARLADGQGVPVTLVPAA